MKKSIKYFVPFLLLALFLFPLKQINAQDQIALQINPLKSFYSIEAGSETEGKVLLSNLSLASLRITPRVVAFETVDDQGTLQIIEGDYSDYVKFPVSVFEMEAQQKREIKYVITAPQTAIGGKYLAILFASEAVEDGSGTFISGEVGSLVFIEVLGTVKKEVIIDKFHVDEYIWGKPEFAVSIKNIGNTQVLPYGEVKIFTWCNKLRDTITFEFPPILPGKERALSFKSEKVLFGKYTASLNLIEQGDLKIEERAFWVFSKGPIIIIGCAIIIFIFILGFFIKKIKK